MLRLYVYYRVPRESVPALRARWQALRDRWQLRVPALRGELLVRCDDKSPGEDLTLMEIWSLEERASGIDVAETIRAPGSAGDAASGGMLQALEEDLASELGTHIRGPRHVERFEPLQA